AGGTPSKKLPMGRPTCHTGRIGLVFYRKDPNTIFAIIDSENFGKGPPQVAEAYLGINGEDAETGTRLTQISKDSPAAKAGVMKDDIVIGIDAKTIATYKQLVEELKTHKPNDKIT